MDDGNKFVNEKKGNVSLRLSTLSSSISGERRLNAPIADSVDGEAGETMTQNTAASEQAGKPLLPKKASGLPPLKPGLPKPTVLLTEAVKEDVLSSQGSELPPFPGMSAEKPSSQPKIPNIAAQQNEKSLEDDGPTTSRVPLPISPLNKSTNDISLTELGEHGPKTSETHLERPGEMSDSAERAPVSPFQADHRSDDSMRSVPGSVVDGHQENINQNSADEDASGITAGFDMSGISEAFNDSFDEDEDDGCCTEAIASPESYFAERMGLSEDQLNELPKPGDQLGNYEIIEEVGRGGFGAVYRVRNKELDREEALKLVLPSALEGCRDVGRRFEREINIASRLEHPNVVRLYNCGTHENRLLWMSMELIRGKALGEIMPQGPMPFKRAQKIMLQILSGLQIAHRNQIIHRDLKPGNVMLCEKDGYKDLVTILDFGLSKAIGPQEDATVQNVTQAFSRCIYGTPNYMAPEQFANGILSPCVDVYAAGIIFLELLTGKNAFTGSAFEIACMQRTNPIPIPSHLKNTAVAAVIQKACEKQASMRYPNAGKFYEDLRKIKSLSDRADVLKVEDFNCEDAGITCHYDTPSAARMKASVFAPLNCMVENNPDLIPIGAIAIVVLFLMCLILFIIIMIS